MLYQKLIFIKKYFKLKSNIYYMAIKLQSKSNVIEFYKIILKNMNEVIGSEVMVDNVKSKKWSIGKWWLIGVLVAWWFAVQSILNPTPLVAGWDNNIDWTSFSENFSKKYEKCWNYTKNKCAEVSPEFTFLWDQEIDIDFFKRNNITDNNGGIKLTDNGHTVLIKDWDITQEAIFWKEVRKIFKNDAGELSVVNSHWETTRYKITKVNNGMTYLEKQEKIEVTYSIDWENFQSIEKMEQTIKSLDLWWKVWKIIDIDNENWEVYNLFFNWKKIPFGHLMPDTRYVVLTKEWKLTIKDKSVNWKAWNVTIFQLTMDLNWEISAKQIEREFVYKK